MKKVLSVVLCVIMIAVAVPFAVSAAGDYTYTTGGVFNVADFNSRVTAGTDTFYIGTTESNGAVALTLNPADMLTIPRGVTLIVNSGSTLTVNGSVQNDGSIICKGTITVTNGRIVNNAIINVGEALFLGDVVNGNGVLNINKNLGLQTGDDSITNIYGKLDVLNGSITTYGEIKIYGTLVNGVDKITAVDSGKCLCQVRFPNLSESGLQNVITVGYNISNSTDEYSDIAGLNYKPTNTESSTATIEVPFGTYLYIQAAINEVEATDKYDDGKFPVSYNGSRLIFGTTGYSVCVTTSGDISYGTWGNGNQYLNTYKVLLPTGDGYTVYARNGETGTLTVTWGQSLAFRIEVDEEYDQSAYEVYIYDGYGWMSNAASEVFAGVDPVEPDQNGFYNLLSIEGDHTIYVVGIMKNETINMVGNILDTLKNVFDMFMELFQQFMAFFQNMGN